MSLDKIVDVQYDGDEKCNHLWVYNSSNKMIMSFPPHFINMRVCETCGRVEDVDRTTMTKGNSTEYTEVYTKFHEKITK